VDCGKKSKLPRVATVLDEPNNTVLCVHSLLKCTEVTVVKDDEALFSICRRNLDIERLAPICTTAAWEHLLTVCIFAPPRSVERGPAGVPDKSGAVPAHSRHAQGLHADHFSRGGPPGVTFGALHGNVLLTLAVCSGGKPAEVVFAHRHSSSGLLMLLASHRCRPR